MTDQVQANPNEGKARKHKRMYIMLAACIVLILIATLFGSMIQTAGWSATVEDLRDASNKGTITRTPVNEEDPTVAATPKTYTLNGKVASGILYMPKKASAEDPRPAVIFTHGLYNNREMQLQNAIEMVRRGYVVLVIDHGAHGHNTNASASGLFMNFYDASTFINAAMYLYNLPQVDKAKIAVSGHSMGGAATAQALSTDGVFDTNQTDANFKAGKGLGLISAGLVQANNAPSRVGSNVLAAGIVKASSDEFFFRSDLKEPAYVPVHKDTVTEDNYTNYYLKKGDEYVKQTAEDKFRPRKQYYNLTTVGTTSFYLQSKQAVTFTGRDATTLEDWTTINGGIYANSMLIAEPNGKKLASVATEGRQLSSAVQSIRVVYEAKETHPMNHFSTKTAAHVIDFFYNAFGTVEEVGYKAPTNQTWWLKEAFALLGFLGLFGMIIPMIDLLLETRLFASLKGQPAEAPMLLKRPRKHVSYWLGGILTAIFGAYSLKHMTAHDSWASKISGYFAASEGFIYSNIADIAFWGICCAAFALIITGAIWVINRIINVVVYKDEFAAHDENPFAGFQIRSWKNIIKTPVLAIFIVAVFYGVVNLLWKMAVVDFRIWTFDIRVFDLERLPSMLKYVPYFFIFYMVSAAMAQNYRVKDLPEWATTAINVVFNVIGLIIIIGAANGYFIRTGAMADSGNNLWYIACYPIIPCVAIATVLARRIYLRTGNAWLAGIINALIMTFIACANTSIEGAVQWIYGA